MFSRPASICFSGANDVLVPGLIARRLDDLGFDVRLYRVGPRALGREDPGQIGLLMSLDQDLRQIVEPVERKLPALQIYCLAGNPGCECSDSGNVRLGQHQSSDVRWTVHGVGMRDPRSDVMRDDVDAAGAREAGCFKKTVQVACGRVEIVTSGRLVALAESARVQNDDPAARADQQRQNRAPSDPALGPARQQQHRIAGPGRHIMETGSVDPRDRRRGSPARSAPARPSRARCRPLP